LPADAEDKNPDRLFSYIGIVRQFRNLQTVSIYWNPLADTDVRLLGLKAAAQNLTNQDQGLSSGTLQDHSTTTKLAIIIGDCPAAVTDERKIEQLGYFLLQIGQMPAQMVYLDLGTASTLHTADSGPLWSSLAEALGYCEFPGLERLHLKLGYLQMDGEEIGVDFCVS
jgi:hypothetical protein